MLKSDQQKCSVFSFNVRGLGDTVNRRSIHTYFKGQKANFYFLQETFSNVIDEAI